MNRRSLIHAVALTVAPGLLLASLHSQAAAQSPARPALPPLTTPTAVLGPVLDATTWAEPHVSVEQDPTTIVESAPSGSPLTIVTTTRTDRGPGFESVQATDEAAAEALIADAQADPNTLAVSTEKQMSIAVSNDALRNRQWALNPDMLDAKTVWTTGRGAGVVVAVIGTGVQANHPDLSGHVLPGYNAMSTTSDVSDINGHGTHVAGIIAAIAGNGIGIAGFAPESRILPVKVFDADGEGSTTDVAKGITWAANHGADVINLSLAGDDDQAVKTAIQYAQSKGLVVVAAAGNKSCNLATPTAYPAKYPGVIGVASIDRDRGVSGFSSCGDWVDVAAPGGGIWSTVPPSTYASLNGTSMAAPYVSALAAIVLERADSVYDKSLAMENLLTSTAHDLGQDGRDPSYGAGLIDPLAALNRALGVQRIAGNDRYLTSVKISKTTFSPGVRAVFIAAGNYFADGLTGGPAAAKLGGPLLLVPGNRVPAAVSAEINRLNPAKIYVLGGTGVVSAKVVGQLTAFAPVERVAGSDRYGTSAKVAEFWTNASTVYMASGAMFADALSGGAAAAREGAPLLLTSPTRLPAATRTELQRLRPSRVVIVGGSAAISNGVVASVKAALPPATVSRVGGDDRYETSAKLADTSRVGSFTVMVASGENFPDALSGVPASAALSVPFVISRSGCMPSAVKNAFDNASIDKYILLGGTAVLSSSIVTRVC